MIFDWQTVLGFTGTLLLLLLVFPYLSSIVRSTTRPSAVSWFGWALLYVIATAAQASKGVDWSLAIPLISTFSTATIAIIALRMGRVVWTGADLFCVAAAVAAIVLWAITQEPLTALILAIIADLAVTTPTIIKTYADPTSEPVVLWALYTTACIFAVVATRELTIYNLLVPVYTVLGSAVITALARGGLSHRTL